MGERNFIADESKCIHCGLCVKDCIEYAIEFDENKIPKMTKPEICINCQHCFAICPTGAIAINGKKVENSQEIKKQNPEDILNLIKSRRSDRQYKNENISAEKLTKLKDMLKWVPTGCNYHKLKFSFIDDVEVMNDYRNKVNTALKKVLAEDEELAGKFGSFKDVLFRGEDLIFRGAPHLLVVSNDKNAPCSNEDGVIALSYFEMYAQSMGLGTCWCGFMKTILQIFPEFCQYLEIPEDYDFCYAILFGEKAVNYQRTTQPNEVIIKSVSKK